MTSSSLPYWLAAHHLKGVGSRRFLDWLSSFQSIQSLFQASPLDWGKHQIPDRYFNQLKQPNWAMIEKELAWGQQDAQHLIAFDSKNYPPQLKEIHDPPLVLYVLGNKEALKLPQIAMVGSRRASTYGLKNALEFADAFTRAGLVVTSGLALGIDGAAHRGALQHQGLTIAVLGTGVDGVYPRSHQALRDEILTHQGALVSEFSLGVPPKAAHFPQRNRLISGLSLGVVVIEAALKSGSLITVRYALEQGREVFAVPGSIHQPQMRGCHALIKQGAKLIETVDDVLMEINLLFDYKANLKGSVALLPAKAAPVLNENEKRVLEKIEHEITSLDVIVFSSGLTVSEVSSILLTLELHELIHSTAGGYYRLK